MTTLLTQRHVAVALALDGQNQHLTGNRIRSDQMQDGSLQPELVLAGRLLAEAAHIVECVVGQAVQIDIDEFQLNVHRTIGALLQRHGGHMQRIDRHQIDARIAFGELLDQDCGRVTNARVIADRTALQFFG